MPAAEQDILILGTRTLAEEIADFASEVPGVHVAGFVENMDRSRCGHDLEGLPVHWVDDMPAFAESHLAVCGLATTQRSRFADQVAALGMRFATLVHPTARISRKSEIGEGTVLSPGVVIASHTTLGRHVFVNRGALIGHHTTIGNYVTIQPGANVAGACRICDGAYIGMGASIIDHSTVGSGVVVGAGAVVTKDVPGGVQVVGVPARVVKENIPGK